MQAWNVRFSAEGRSALFPSEALRRRAVTTLCQLTDALLVVFAVLDDHIHYVLLCSRQRAGKVNHDLLLALRAVASVPLDPAWMEPVRGRAHMLNLVDYLLTQTVHHDIPTHPALWSGSCFSDLVGARTVTSLTPQLFEVLPRYRLREAYRSVGLPETPFVPVSDDLLRDMGMARLVQATASALCLEPALTGRADPVVEARAVVAHLGDAAGFSSGDIAIALRASQRSARRLRRQPVPGRSLQAVRTWLAMEKAIAANSASLPCRKGRV